MDSRTISQVGLRVIAEGTGSPAAVTASLGDTAGSIFDRAMRHMVDAHRDSELVLRNVTVNGRRTTIRLEPEMWDALTEIARRENYTQTQLCSRIADGQPQGLSFTASVRMFILTYFRTAAHGGTSASGIGEAGVGRKLLNR
ncbi:hypothetical protein GCM10011497_28910 [Elstera cyanobacteriorum]|uniref:Ribbon-helix-helix domain-containing protein n=1 Tax=Elstera cyanobacteriorum TaxID=2022747 RepID=A0A255XSJ7_9PROT|nr:ribbon-helix-helix domain-containing protein [Elstera cyanobacteriorum]OYQ19913.1 hypothetical protein CHR90_07290 [Elstera cyanobacteriorum]GFZ96483.1 hypothetical protein GCM10011497_28910 [Elstera cyanobacteriorum]